MATTINLTSGPDLWFPLVDPLNPVTDAVTVNALQGNDTITGTAFADLLLGNEGNDILEGREGDDVIYGGQGDDTIKGEAGNNLLLGNFGNDIIEGSTGNDVIYGGQDNDNIKGLGGNDLLLGNLGNDTIEGSTGNDTIFGGQDNDLIKGADGNNEIYGNLGDDTIEAGSGNDYIHGGQGEDVILASAGIDTLIGGMENDTLMVTSDIDLSISTVMSIEIFNIDETATLIASFDNLGDVSILSGTGTIQILGTTVEVEEFITSLGEGVSVDLTIQDEDGNNINNGEPTADATLTVGQDIISATGVISAPVVFVPAIGNTPTLESVDKIQGLGEDDSLIATMQGTIFGTGPNTLDIVPEITGVETISIRAISDVFFDAINTTGTKTFISNASPNLLAIDRIQELPESFSLINSAGSLIATVADQRLSGSSDAVNILLENVNGVGEFVSVSSIASTQGYETFNVESTGTVINRLNGIVDGAFFDKDIEMVIADPDNYLKTINITGDQDLELIGEAGVVSSSVTRIDASGLVGNLRFASFLNNEVLSFIGGEGNVNFNFSGLGNEDLTFTGGKGNVNLNFSDGDIKTNDKLIFTGGEGDVSINMGRNLDPNDKIDGGVGDNSITATFIGNVGPLDIKNVQTLLLTTNFSAPANVSFDKSDNSIELIRITNTGIVTDLTIDAIKSLPKIELQGSGESTNDSTKQFSALNILSTAVSGGNDTLVIDINNQGTQLNSNVGYQLVNGFIPEPGVVADPFAIRADAVENIELNIADGNLNFTVIDGKLTPDANPGDIIGRGIQSLKVTSADNVQLGNIFNPNPDSEAANSITSIDATGVVGRFVAESEDLKGGAVVNLGNGGSLFDASLSTTDGVKFNGGTGVDQIIGATSLLQNDGSFKGGDDIITGNAGADIINLTAGIAGGQDRVILNQTATRDVITGFTLADADNKADDEIAVSNATYGTLSAGQKYDIITAGAFNPTDNNVGSTIVQGTMAEIQGLGNDFTSRVRFVSVTGADVNTNGTTDTQLFYSANGSFANLGNANSIALLDDLNGFTATFGSNEVIPVA